MALQIEVYDSGVTRLDDPENTSQAAQDINFETYYPGGLYGAALFYVEREILRSWMLRGAKRVVLRDGSAIVYEGYVGDLTHDIGEQVQGTTVNLLGAWAHILMNRRWRKVWADQRIEEDVWQWLTAASGAEKCEVDRNNRLRFTPKNVQWTIDQQAQIRYLMPVGETVKRVTFNYDLQEAAQAWQLIFWSPINGTIWNVTASGTGSQDITLGTADNEIQFFFKNNSGGNQTPPSDGTVYGQISNLIVRSETSDINMDEIATDIVGHFTELNSATNRIGVPAADLSLLPYITEGYTTAADILFDVTNRGDGNNNRWAAYLIDSESVPSPNGKPVLVTEQIAALTTPDYVVSLNDGNVGRPISITEDTSSIKNWIVVEYQDANGWVNYITPDTDATLKDQTSIDAHGQRDEQLSIGSSTLAIATDIGVKYLADNKNPKYNADSISVTGNIRTAAGGLLPVSHVTAGKLLKIEDFTDDKTGAGTGLTLRITRTAYVEEIDTVTMQFGKLDTFVMPVVIFPPAAEEVITPAPSTETTETEQQGQGGSGRSGGSRGKRRRRQTTIPAPAPAPAPIPTRRRRTGGSPRRENPMPM